MSATKRRLFRGRAAGNQRGRVFILGVGLAVLIFFAVQFYIGFNAPNSIPGRSYYTFTLLSKNADNVEAHDGVAVGGQFLAGQILSEKVENGLAHVKIQLAKKYGPLRASTTAKIRLRSAVGTRYLELVPGKTGPFIPNGGSLAPTQSKSPVDLDEVLDTFNKPTQAGTQRFFGQLGVGLMERGQTVNNLLGEAPGFLTSLGSVSQAINSRGGAMAQFIREGRGVADEFNPVRYNLANGFKPGTKALQPFINQRSGVQSTLDDAPGTLSTASADLPQINRLLAQVDGLAQAAVPTLHAAPAALHQTSRLLTVAEGPLKQANATLIDLKNAVNPAVGFLRETTPELPRLNEAFTNLEPTVQYLAPRSCGISDALSGWPEMMKNGGASENYILFTVTKDPTIVTGSGPLLASPYPGPCSAGDNVGGPYSTPEQAQANQFHEPLPGTSTATAP